MNAAAKLRQIREQMLDLLGDAEMVISRHEDDSILHHAQAYWLHQIHSALERQDRYSSTMEDTINHMAGNCPECGGKLSGCDSQCDNCELIFREE